VLFTKNELYEKYYGFGVGHSSFNGMHMGGNWHPMASSNPMSQVFSSALHGQVTGHSIPSFPIGPPFIGMHMGGFWHPISS